MHFLSLSTRQNDTYAAKIVMLTGSPCPATAGVHAHPGHVGGGCRVQPVEFAWGGEQLQPFFMFFILHFDLLKTMVQLLVAMLGD